MVLSPGRRLPPLSLLPPWEHGATFSFEPEHGASHIAPTSKRDPRPYGGSPQMHERGCNYKATLESNVLQDIPVYFWTVCRFPAAEPVQATLQK